VLEVNGIAAPIGTFGASGEFETPTPPTGAPWDHVLDWRTGALALGPGDFAVLSLQFRLGDGDMCDDYPTMFLTTCGLILPSMLFAVKSTEADWPAAAARELAATSARPLNSPSEREEIMQPLMDDVRFARAACAGALTDAAPGHGLLPALLFRRALVLRSGPAWAQGHEGGWHCARTPKRRKWARQVAEVPDGDPRFQRYLPGRLIGLTNGRSQAILSSLALYMGYVLSI
jgi:hypothetical protein